MLVAQSGAGGEVAQAQAAERRSPLSRSSLRSAARFDAGSIVASRLGRDRYIGKKRRSLWAVLASPP